MASDVFTKDMGFAKAIDRLHALAGASVTVGSLAPPAVAKYAAIHEHRFGWKTAADHRMIPIVEGLMGVVRARVLAGDESFKTILQTFGDRIITEYQDQIRGNHGTRRLYKTGAMVRSIRRRVRSPR